MPPTATLSFDLDAAPHGDAPARAAADAAADLAACRAQLADGSRTFLAASRLLPRAVREPACALYAFCRTADDAVDLRELPEALLDGFEWDARGRRYETIEDLHDYAARVAGTVGAMMAVLMRRRSPEALARACDLGVAMQLSNIARDVGEDARRGRVYLPLAWLREAGVDPDAWLADPVFDARIASVVRRLLRHADALYARVDAGIALLPPGCRPGIQAARVLYAEIGHEVERRGCDSVSQRAVVPGRRKAALLARALAQGAVARRRPGAALPPLEAVRHLVDAAARTDAPPPVALRTAPDAGAQRGVPSLAFARRAVWVIELCEQQEHRRVTRREGAAQRS